MASGWQLQIVGTGCFVGLQMIPNLQSQELKAFSFPLYSWFSWTQRFRQGNKSPQWTPRGSGVSPTLTWVSLHHYQRSRPRSCSPPLEQRERPGPAPQETALRLGCKHAQVTVKFHFNYCELLPSAPSVSLMVPPPLSCWAGGRHRGPSII